MNMHLPMHARTRFEGPNQPPTNHPSLLVHPTDSNLVNHIYAGIDSTPSYVAGYSGSGGAVATVASQTFTVATTWFEPEQTAVVAVLHDGMMALLAEGNSVTLASQPIAVPSSGVVVIGTGAEAATVTAS